jgi:hypothetical protein
MAAPKGDDIAEDVQGPETYKFELYHKDSAAGSVTLPVAADWAAFKAAVKAKVGFEIVSIKYDDDFGPHKEQDIVCNPRTEPRRHGLRCRPSLVLGGNGLACRALASRPGSPGPFCAHVLARAVSIEGPSPCT